jgi:hypothetical protein
MVDAVEERREALEDLAERDDLNCSKYAKALLDAVEEG